MAVFYDQLNREVNISSTPKKIISVVPSQTELLFYLGLDAEVVGITKFCIHPANKFKTTTKVGGTKQLDINKIKELKPDLVIANKEENEQSQIKELIGICPVWVSDISDLSSALDMIKKVGQLVARESEALALNELITDQFNHLSIQPAPLKVAYFIWRKPYIVAGKQTFINDMLSRCGLVNVFNEGRYPKLNQEQLIAANPDIVLLSSEPYPFTREHIEELKLILPKSKIILVNGEMFSWYGSRLLYAPTYFEQLTKNLRE